MILTIRLWRASIQLTIRANLRIASEDGSAPRFSSAPSSCRRGDINDSSSMRSRIFEKSSMPSALQFTSEMTATARLRTRPNRIDSRIRTQTNGQ